MATFAGRLGKRRSKARAELSQGEQENKKRKQNDTPSGLSLR